ncbi:hypothetical protein QCA50_005819 [Cerrena zonata]|uniref:WD40 repeat-like protein n=1 Tax=Cerrena zonata TaxID=2478898 RepID=A0AAW0GBI5_9APHY
MEGLLNGTSDLVGNAFASEQSLQPESHVPGSGVSTPLSTNEGDPERRRRARHLLILLRDELQNIAREKEAQNRPPEPRTPFDNDSDIPIADQELQDAGAAAFNKVEKQLTTLDRELRHFRNSVRKLGSSARILSSSFHLRDRLANILFLFRENAANLFPRKVKNVSLDSPNLHRSQSSRNNARTAALLHPITHTVVQALEIDELPNELQSFAADINIFLHCLNEFPEFTDENMNAAIFSCEQDLTYWASCLKAYAGQFQYPAVRQYIHDISSDLGEHLQHIASAIRLFIENGVPTILFTQKHVAANLLNLSTVATLFSGVTVTTLQFSFEDVGTPLGDSVNGFWFMSLVFSIGAGCQQLARADMEASNVPFPKSSSTRMAVACFSAGLVLFTFSSNQNPITSIITTVLSGFSCFGLLAVSAWFLSERWVFHTHNGQKWLADSLSESGITFSFVPGITWLMRIQKDTVRRLVLRGLQSFIKFLETLCSKVQSAEIDEEIQVDVEAPSVASVHSPRISRSFSLARQTTLPSINISFSGTGSQTHGSHSQLAVASLAPVPVSLRPLTPVPPLPNSIARRRWHNAVQSYGPDSVKDVQPPMRTPPMRVAHMSSALRDLKVSETLNIHQALIRDLQFSPDGRMLATASWDHTATIYKVGTSFEPHRVLAHPNGFIGALSWSPTGHMLLTRLQRGFKLWDEDGVCRKTVDRKASVQSISWFPRGEALLSVENGALNRLDLNGNATNTYVLDDIQIRRATITPDGTRALCVGTLLAPGGIHPDKSRSEKQIFVYNLGTREVEARAPVLRDIGNIKMSKRKQVALVTYEDQSPPQLWELESPDVHDSNCTRLILRQTYMPNSKAPLAIAGTCQFGGKDERLVISVGKGNEVHIWDRNSAQLLYQGVTQEGSCETTCFAWNQGYESLMFAAGSVDGAVTILAAPEISSAKIYKADIGEHPRRVLPQPSGLKDIAESTSGLSVEQQTNPRLSLALDEDYEDARGLGTVG